MNSGSCIRLGAIMAFLGVSLGAFGAHALAGTLEANEHVDTWKTAVLYQLVHALALIGLGLLPESSRLAAWSFAAGILLFSGSLYVLSLTGFSKLGMITPLGGVAFLFGWAALALHPGMGSSRRH